MPRGKQITKTIQLEECTLGQAKEEFYKNNKVKGLAKETQRGYQNYIDHFAKWCGEDTPMSEITTKKLDDYLCAKAEKEIKDVTLATVMVHIRRFINFCVAREYMEKIQVTIPKFEQELKDPYTEEEIRKLLARPKTKQWVEWRCYTMTNYFFRQGNVLVPY